VLVGLRGQSGQIPLNRHTSFPDGDSRGRKAFRAQKGLFSGDRCYCSIPTPPTCGTSPASARHVPPPRNSPDLVAERRRALRLPLPTVDRSITSSSNTKSGRDSHPAQAAANALSIRNKPRAGLVRNCTTRSSCSRRLDLPHVAAGKGWPKLRENQRAAVVEWIDAARAKCVPRRADRTCGTPTPHSADAIKLAPQHRNDRVFRLPNLPPLLYFFPP